MSGKPWLARRERAERRIRDENASSAERLEADQRGNFVEVGLTA